MKRIFLVCIMTLLAGAPFVSAQQPDKAVRIAMAMAGTPEGLKYRVDAFVLCMRELGYIEGRNLRIEYRYTGGTPEGRKQIVAEVVRLKPDVIVVSSTCLTADLKKATNTIPIVVGNAGDLVGTGVVASLARPGGNVTGSTDMAPDIAAKRVELAKEFVPRLSRLGVILHGSRGFSDEQELNQIQAATRQLGIATQVVGIREVEDFQHAFALLAGQKTEALIIIQGPFTFQHNKQLSELALKYRLPAVCEETVWSVNGCLVSFGPDKAHSFRRAAVFVDKIVRGVKPADLPVEQPMRFELTANSKTAKTLGIPIPPGVLVRATLMIE